MIKNFKYIWFLFGLGSQLQVVASLSFTEIFVYLAGPILFVRELSHMKRNGIMPFWWFSMAVLANAVLAIVVNHTEFHYALRGMAVVCLLPCAIVVGHWMLRKDMNGFKWMLIGIAISTVLCTFVFHRSVEVAMLARGSRSSEEVSEAIMGGPIFWINRLGAWATLFPKGWYMQCPTFMAAGLPLAMAAFSLLTSASGRSAALGALGSAVLVILGGKRPGTIRKRICKNFWLLCVAGIVMIFVFKAVYQTSASTGMLGEKARVKYEQQTQGDSSIKKLLLGGRMESFCGLIACIDKPIIGFGPWARDEVGYTREFLSKYGTYEDYDSYLKHEQYGFMMGFDAHLIPCHAYITEFWLWYGIAGLLFWLYIVFVLIRYLRQDCYVVPQWYMWLAAAIPGYMWGVFFSPFSDRVGSMVFVVAVLMARAVRQGCQPLPAEMLAEIQKVERK